MSWYANVLAMALTALVALVPGLGYLSGGGQAARSETVTRTLALRQPDQVFELSNVNGSVRIVAEERSDVSVTATRTVDRQGSADDPGPALDFREESDRMLVCGDATHCGCHINLPENRRDRDDDRTQVRVDFDVRVPRAATLDICTVNGGSVRVEGTEGRYTLRNVNGGVQMVRVRGAGRATTVNGSVDATFTAAPEAASEFKTVNGHVDVSLPASLSADLRLTTMNGGLYTDFDTTPLPSTPSTVSTGRHGGRFVSRPDRFAAVRVGQGGPELTFETLNGDVQVRKK